MQFTPRAFLSLAVGGLLTLVSPKPGVFAEDTKPAPESPAASSAPTMPSATIPADTQTTQPAADLTPQKSAALTIQPTPEEIRSVELVNRERKKLGLAPLTIDPTLIAVAREHSKEMMEKKYFSHQSPTPGLKTPMDRFLKVVPKPEYACVGENLFYCTVVDVQRGHLAFMNSPTHRDNVVFPRYEKIGVGIIKNEKGEFWITQMYLTTTDPIKVAKRMGMK